jgi:hypothetical protein
MSTVDAPVIAAIVAITFLHLRLLEVLDDDVALFAFAL